jgi:hypothetical protein
LIDRAASLRAPRTVALLLYRSLVEDAWLAPDFPLEPAALASIADQAVAGLNRDLKINKN